MSTSHIVYDLDCYHISLTEAGVGLVCSEKKCRSRRRRYVGYLFTERSESRSEEHIHHGKKFKQKTSSPRKLVDLESQQRDGQKEEMGGDACLLRSSSEELSSRTPYVSLVVIF